MGIFAKQAKDLDEADLLIVSVDEDGSTDKVCQDILVFDSFNKTYFRAKNVQETNEYEGYLSFDFQRGEPKHDFVFPEHIKELDTEAVLKAVMLQVSLRCREARYTAILKSNIDYSTC